MALRLGPGRTPDPDRPGTVYRAQPFRLPDRDDAPAEPGDGGPRPARRRRRRRAPWVLLALLLLVGYPLALFGVAWSALDRVAALPADSPADTPGRTFLVVGSDSREDLTAEERKALGTGKADGRRTDTIMLLHVPGGGGPTVLLSIPRDSYVPIPGHGRNKINAAFSIGGPTLLVQTVEQVSGVHVDEYVETGFGGFARMVDAVGGVRLCPKRDIVDEKAHLDIRKGCQEVDGPTALGYARARYSDPRGDLGRVERQREVLQAIAGKTLSPSVLLMPWRSFPAARGGGDALAVDESTSPLALARFVLGMRGVAGGDGVSLTVPISDPNLSTPAGSAVQWDREEALRVFRAISANDTDTLREVADAQEAARS